MQTFNFLKTGGQEEKSKDNRGGNDCKLSIISSEMWHNISVPKPRKPRLTINLLNDSVQDSGMEKQIKTVNCV